LFAVDERSAFFLLFPTILVVGRNPIKSAIPNRARRTDANDRELRPQYANMALIIGDSKKLTESRSGGCRETVLKAWTERRIAAKLLGMVLMAIDRVPGRRKSRRNPIYCAIWRGQLDRKNHQK
jgi:hypothetical protein